MQPKPPGLRLLDGEDKHVYHPGIDRALLYNELGKKDTSCFGRVYLGYGWRWGKNAASSGIVV